MESLTSYRRMHIPRAWAKVIAAGKLPDGRSAPVAVWGWGEDESSARSNGSDRLRRVLERFRRGEPFPDKYGYGNRPLREEILQSIESATANEVAAIVTRNGYGAEVLNAARLLFLDIDLEPPSFIQRILGPFRRVSPQESAVSKLCDALRQYGRATFRIYQTASGLRAMAIDREYDPTGQDVQQLMQATGTDSAFARLCMAQRSFRARLTPKPWRCKLSVPPGQHPRVEAEAQRRFATWLREYERVSTRYATCRYLETVGSGSARGDAKQLVELHDRATRCNESLALA